MEKWPPGPTPSTLHAHNHTSKTCESVYICLVFEPGTTTAYSSYGWVLVSAVVERVAHAPFAEYMKDHVFVPTGMRETYLADSVESASQVALLYADETLVVPENLSSVLSTGGFSSTVTDLVRYGSAVMADEQFLSSETREWMFQRQKTNDGEEGPFERSLQAAAGNDRAVRANRAATVKSQLQPFPISGSG